MFIIQVRELNAIKGILCISNPDFIYNFHNILRCLPVISLMMFIQ